MERNKNIFSNNRNRLNFNHRVYILQTMENSKQIFKQNFNRGKTMKTIRREEEEDLLPEEELPEEEDEDSKRETEAGL